jgi:hypothetical protein
MKISTIEQAVEVLEGFEYSLDGFVKRAPERSDFEAAFKLIKDKLGIKEPVDPTGPKFGPKFDIKSKARKRMGHIYQAEPSGMFAEVGKDIIRITGRYGNKNVHATFKVGDMVEYDSYNLRYLGTITRITDKRVTVQPRYGASTKSMDLYTFAWRNHNFDLDKANAENAETSMSI